MGIDALLHRIEDVAPAATALCWRGRPVSFGTIAAAAQARADDLRAAGVQPGQRVAVVGGNVPATVVVLFATWILGAVAVPLSERLRAGDLARALDATDPDVVVVVAAPVAGAVPVGAAEVGPRPAGVLQADAMGEDMHRLAAPSEGAARSAGEMPPGTALVLTTSGSSGPPKAVLVSHRREVESAGVLARHLGLDNRDVVVLPVPVSHAFGLSCLLSAMAAGASTVLVDATTSPASLAEALDGATVVHGSPTLFASLVHLGETQRLRTGFVAGAPSPPGLLERLDHAGITVLNLYGMTELGATAAPAMGDAAPVRWTTAGRALPGHELRVVGGELQVRGPHVTAGYFGQPERTAGAFVDGWFRTGDLAEIDPSGNLVLKGRLDDLVDVAGFTVSPAEIEQCLLEHPAVGAACVVGLPHDRLGHRLAAFVVTRDGQSLAARDLLAHTRRRLAGYKVPYRVEFMEDFPRLATGKPDRASLRTMAAETG